MSQVIIHCKPIVEHQCYENGYNWSFSDVYGKDEIDILVDNIEDKLSLLQSVTID